MKSTHKYRPDVDGLRALAILPVILYHAGLGCSGGFVGVDIFFVISGFLITGLILEEINDGTFSLPKFWERRIRRILPALSVMVLATLIAGWFLFWPADFELLARSALAQSVLLANVFFWRTVNYFNPGNTMHPLIHTWSLAVEEQFYLAFPPLLLMLARYRLVSTTRAILWLCVGLFALSIAGSYLAMKASYYLLPTRAWELMLGALLASIPGREIANPRLNEAAGLTGLGLILWTIFDYTGAIRFPGLASAPPCVGAALVIFSGTARRTLVSRLLAWKPFVFTGLISYPLYLWHWPLLAFATYASRGPLSWQFRAGLLATSFVLATISWKFLETPLRKRWIWPRAAQAFAFAGCSQLTLIIVAAIVVGHHGMESRMAAQSLKYYNFRNDFAFRNEISAQQAAAGEFAELGSPGTNQPISLLLWGDSHAMAVAPVLDELCRRYSVRGVEATHSMTAPVLGYDSKRMIADVQEDEKSLAFSQSVGEFIARNHVKIVIIAALWADYDPVAEVDARLTATVRAVMASGARVYVLKDVPNPGFNVPRFVAMAAYHHEDFARLQTSPQKYAADNQAYETMFQHVSEAGATVLDPAKYLLNDRGNYDVLRGDTLLYWDANHLTIEGSKLLTPLFEPLFQTK